MRYKNMIWIVAVAGLSADAAAQPEKKPAPAAKPAGAVTAPVAQPEKKPDGKQPDAKPAAPKQPGGMQPGGAPSPEQMKAMQEMMKEMSAPGPEHQQLAKKVGEWKTTTKFQMPGMPAENTTGKSKISMILGGRFMTEEASGTMMGQGYDTFKLVGYNKNAHEYEGVWAYTMGTNTMSLVGKSDDGGKTITWKATFSEAPGAKESVTIVVKNLDDDHFTVTMNDQDGQSGGATMETAYERVKPSTPGK